MPAAEGLDTFFGVPDAYKRRVDDTAKPLTWAIYSPSKIAKSTLTERFRRVNVFLIA
jgi:hypothetical protein